MNKESLIISETPWLAMVVSILIPVGLIGWALEATWVHINISSPIIIAFIIVILFVAEVYLILRGIWPRKIVVDLKKHQLIMVAYCPFIYTPTYIDFSEIKKIRVGDYNSFHTSGRVFNLIVEKSDGSEITFGDWNGRDQSKYEHWRDEIVDFARINNITRNSS